MTAFADLGLSRDALKAVERLEYTEPTPVQEQAIPIVLEGRDLIAAASTGTGKTAAFLLPILSTLPRAGRGKRAPRVLVVTPTRELAQQISFTCIKIARATGHFATTVYGGTPYNKQIRELRGGTDVLIATPGRLKDLMDRGVVELGSISTLVLDEADRMLDMGFLPDVTTIVEATPESRQTLLFSATIDQSIENNLGSLLHDPAVVQIAHKGETAKTVEQFVMPITQRDKAELLRAVLKEKGSERVIVFARTKTRTEECAEMLRGAGFSAESIHSDKSQGQRRRALENFRRGRTDVLVATDVLARGIDVTDVDHVINYDLPDMPEDYVHRIGRTGRAGKQGYAISFVSPDTRRILRDVERLIDREIPFMELESYELDPSILKSGGKNKSKGDSRRKGKHSGGYAGSRNGSRPSGNRREEKATGDNRRRGTSGKSDDRRAGTRNDGRSSNEQNARKHNNDRRATREGSENGGRDSRENYRDNRRNDGRSRRDSNGNGGYGARDGYNSNSRNGKGRSGHAKSHRKGDSRTNDYRKSAEGSYAGHSGQGKSQKKQRPAGINDVRSFGEQRGRSRSKHHA